MAATAPTQTVAPSAATNQGQSENTATAMPQIGAWTDKDSLLLKRTDEIVQSSVRAAADGRIIEQVYGSRSGQVVYATRASFEAANTHGWRNAANEAALRAQKVVAVVPAPGSENRAANLGHYYVVVACDKDGKPTTRILRGLGYHG